jgi:hypothetical protein
LSAGLSMVGSLVQYVWMTLMHSSCSTIGKSLSLVIIKGSFP